MKETISRCQNGYDQILMICFQTNRRLARETRKVIESGEDLVVFGGDHSCAIGTWSGIAAALRPRGELGLIWVDAHMVRSQEGEGEEKHVPFIISSQVVAIVHNVSILDFLLEIIKHSHTISYSHLIISGCTHSRVYTFRQHSRNARLTFARVWRKESNPNRRSNAQNLPSQLLHGRHSELRRRRAGNFFSTSKNHDFIVFLRGNLKNLKISHNFIIVFFARIWPESFDANLL